MKRKILPFIILSIILSSSVFAQKAEELFGLSDFYDVQPDVANCKDGALKDSEKQAILKELNYIRSIHGLKPVEYRSQYDINTAKGALMLAANDDKIGNPDNPHLPPSSWKCFTSQGADGCKNSNLAYRWYSGAEPASLTSLNMWMVDNNVEECGHRRWLIDPFLKFIAFGRADGTSKRFSGMKVTTMQIYVISDEKNSLSGWDSNFVAYPYHDYPKSYFYEGSKTWYLSFTAIMDKSNYWNNQKVDFQNATVEMKEEGGSNAAVTNKQFQNDGYGVPNLLKWKVSGLKNDVKYWVTIKNVGMGGSKKDFSYWFKLTDNPSQGSAPSAAPVLASPANNATNIDVTPTLTWNSVTDAEFYNLEISKSADFTSNTFTYDNITLLLYKPSLDENTKYYWRVRAGNKYGIGPVSSVRNFTTKKLPYYPPVVLTPPDAATNVNNKTVFSWNSVTGAGSYTLQIFASTDLVNPKIEKKGLVDTVFKVNPGDLNSATQYIWWVRGVGMSGASAWSVPRSFWSADVTGIENDFLLNGFTFSLYPNPADERLFMDIKSLSNSDVSIEVFNLMGDKIININKQLESGNQILSLDISNYPAGSYFVRISSQDKGLVKWFSK